MDIPSGTSIPAWAYLNITAEDGFDVVAAENLAGAPESSAAVSSTDVFPASATTSPTSTFITTSTFTTTSNDSSISTASASPFPTNSSSVTEAIILKSSRVSAMVGVWSAASPASCSLQQPHPCSSVDDALPASLPLRSSLQRQQSASLTSTEA
ncbi:hypothetical protein A0H81_07919 [Grifola frondosa]|uniref:Uncharacterized protein n=1 Tax=Grifola frondosa TaxID=5627 RepID=A0A1C7M6T2_GRIFR|nr:hypothetical protein A0H81_07919 [Grifola frondosa]